MSQTASPIPSARSPLSPSQQPSIYPTQVLSLIQSHQWVDLLNLSEQRELDDLGALSNDSELYYINQLIVPFIVDERTAAKFTWKRTGMNDARTRFPSLSAIWKTLTPLYQHDNQSFFASFNGLHQHIQSQTSPFTSTIVQLLDSLHQSIQERAFQSICRIYDYISIESACSLTGVNPADMINQVSTRQWEIVTNEKGTFIKPQRPSTDQRIHLAKDELARLTNYVTSLDLTVDGAK